MCKYRNVFYYDIMFSESFKNQMLRRIEHEFLYFQLFYISREKRVFKGKHSPITRKQRKSVCNYRM